MNPWISNIPLRVLYASVSQPIESFEQSLAWLEDSAKNFSKSKGKVNKKKGKGKLLQLDSGMVNVRFCVSSIFYHHDKTEFDKSQFFF